MNVSVIHTLLTTIPNYGICIPRGTMNKIHRDPFHLKEYYALIEYMKYYKDTAPCIRQVKDMDFHMTNSNCNLITKSGDIHYKLDKKYMDGPVFQLGDDMLNFTEIDYQFVDTPTCDDFCQTPSKQRIYYNWHQMDRTIFNDITCLYQGNALAKLKNVISTTARFYGYDTYNPTPLLESIYILLDKCMTISLYGITDDITAHEYGLLRTLISDGRLYTV